MTNTGIVTFIHTNHNNRTLERKVIPHSLVYVMDYPWKETARVWCLKGFCLDKQALRTFRIIDIKDTTKLLNDLEGKISSGSINKYKLNEHK